MDDHRDAAELGDAMRRGYFGIGIENTKTKANVGTLLRSACIFGAAFVFTVGRRYQEQSSDTLKTWRHIPLFHYETIDALLAGLPHSAPLVGIELDARAKPIGNYVHPERCVYLLGAEDHGLTKASMARCHHLVQLPGEFSLNVATAGSIVMFDRVNKRAARDVTATGGVMAADGAGGP